ncbi:hypothetical protein J2778_004850 [Paraburkholderia graminis]|uniref:hypothetical protein n=1 Tax=Paraburkholderia graminis TaxID=60548 RepID=UPI002864065D|nr:hypothetical protein [Paraburkholderia graminis]MDR6477349.1 hypothetical protein [Paraburkholderia graminis]
MRFSSSFCAAPMLLAFSVAADAACPGNSLSGAHVPDGSPPWSWSLDPKDGAQIWKSGIDNSKVTGKFTMICDQGNWSARLYDMSHGMKYNCSGRVEGSQISEGRCTTEPGGPGISVTGKFSTMN